MLQTTKAGAVAIRTVTFRLLPVVGVVVLTGQPGCKRSEETGPAKPAPKGPEAIVEFPAELKLEDETVMRFVRRVIGTCVEGDYDAFRLLWSAKEDPFPRDAFERGWRAVQRVSILDIQRFRRKVEDDVVYGVHARVGLDESVPEPRREVVLLIVNEADQWRLAKASASLRKRFLATTDEPETADAPATTRPAAPQDNR